tara:strand:- start:287 stop:634 length:348 start_codon:yes stop_codon:yes gene_type:complete
MSPMMFGFSQQRKQILNSEAERFVREMPQLGAKKIILVGDLSVGDVSIDSGLEVLVVQETDHPYKDRADFWVTHLRPTVKADFYVFTPKELSNLSQTDPFLIKSLSIGEVLYTSE